MTANEFDKQLSQLLNCAWADLDEAANLAAKYGDEYTTYDFRVLIEEAICRIEAAQSRYHKDSKKKIK